MSDEDEVPPLPGQPWECWDCVGGNAPRIANVLYTAVYRNEDAWREML